jgi:hypothetical protein
MMVCRSTKSARERKRSTSGFVSTSIFPAQLGENGFKARVTRLTSTSFAGPVAPLFAIRKRKLMGARSSLSSALAKTMRRFLKYTLPMFPKKVVAPPKPDFVPLVLCRLLM